MAEKSNVSAIKEYFEAGESGRSVSLKELKALKLEDRQELGRLCRAELTA